VERREKGTVGWRSDSATSEDDVDVDDDYQKVELVEVEG
jgi:hypothetical protein